MIVKALQSIKVGDSVVLSMEVGYPQYQKVLSEIDARKKFDLLSVLLLKAKKGDTIFSEHPVYKMKKYAYVPLDDSNSISTETIILDVFDNMNDAQADRQKEINAFTEKQKQSIKAYLEKQNISAEETDEGIFIERVSPATAKNTVVWQEVCKDSCLAMVRYEGRLMDGKVFDENYTKGGAFAVRMNTDQVIQGFEIAIKHMQVGETINAYIPSMLAYKEGGTKTRDIKPFQSIMFKITLEKVTPLSVQ